MRWHERLGLRAKRRSSMSRLAIPPSFSLLSLLPLSSLQDDPWLSPPPRLSSCPSSRVAVLHFFFPPRIPLHIGLQIFSYLRLIPGPWKGLFVNCTCQNCKMFIMQRKTKGPARTVVWNLQVFLFFIWRHHSHAQSLQREITDLPLSSFAGTVTAEQIFFCVCVCVSVYVCQIKTCRLKWTVTANCSCPRWQGIR